MEPLDFLEGINEVDPALLAEASGDRRRSGAGRPRWIALAAALLLILGGMTAFAVSGRVTLTGFRNTDESGFRAETELPRVNWKRFRGEVRGAGKIIARQYAEFTPAPAYSSVLVLPGVYGRSFGSLEEAMAYIGLGELKAPTFPYADTPWSVVAEGDERGRVKAVKLLTQHVVPGEFSTQETVTILTEYADDGLLTSGGVWTGEFSREAEFLRHTTPGGNECRIVLLHPQFESNYLGLTGYAVSGCAFYELSLGAVPKAEQEEAVRRLCAWADALD